MDDLNIHDVVSIRTHTDSSVVPFHWRTIIVTNSDGKEFSITLFGKEGNLTIKEDQYD